LSSDLLENASKLDATVDEIHALLVRCGIEA
jgi:hypothetical protein